MLQQRVFDAVVVGGGPAGLVAATYLARFRRSVLVVDAGSSRAASIPWSHNYPGFAEGVSGVTLVASLREQMQRYDIETAVGCVERITRDAASGVFDLHWLDGRATARTVLLATGARDIAPDMPYVTDALRDGALRYCPVCDGFEVIDKAVGVLTDGHGGVGEALYLRHYTERLTVFKSGSGVHFDEADLQRLADAGIALVEAPVDSIRLGHDKATVRHGDTETSCDAIYSALGLRVHSELATALGAEADEDGYLQTDRHQCTSVPGLYAAGDVAQGLNQISVAAGNAATAASAIHIALGAVPASQPQPARA